MKAFALIATIFFVFLAMADVARPPIKVQFFDMFGRVTDESDGNFYLQWDPRTTFRNIPSQDYGKIKTTDRGFIESKIVSKKRKNLVLLGSEMGVSWSSLAGDDTFDSMIEKEFDFGVVNLSTPGFLVGQELASLVHLGMDHSVKYVVSFSGWNDFNEHILKLPVFGYGYSAQWNVVQERLRQGYVKTSKVQKPNLKSSFRPIDRKNWDSFVSAYINNIEKMILVSRAMGAKFILMLQPEIGFKKNKTKRETEVSIVCAKPYKSNYLERYKIFLKSIMKFCRESGAHCINPNDESDFTASREELFGNCSELTDAGFAAIVTALKRSGKIE